MNHDGSVSISVVTATWNCVSTVGSCLDSFSAQSYLKKEHVLIDGASTDGTLEVLRARQSEFGFLLSEPDKGIYDALNKGVMNSSGDVVGFLHADDVYARADVLSRIADAFRDPSVCAVYGDLDYVKKDNLDVVVRRWRTGEFNRQKLAWGWMPAHPTLYVRRDWYAKIGFFNTDLRISADYLSVLSFFRNPDFKSIYIPAVLVKMRLGGESNRSLGNLILKSKEDYFALKRTGVGGVGALAWKNLSKVTQFR
jgi:glycosyltransferase involved in cell wall biosynthesis